jgi:hypothetical protein
MTPALGGVQGAASSKRSRSDRPQSTRWIVAPPLWGLLGLAPRGSWARWTLVAGQDGCRAIIHMEGRSGSTLPIWGRIETNHRLAEANRALGIDTEATSPRPHGLKALEWSLGGGQGMDSSEPAGSAGTGCS